MADATLAAIRKKVRLLTRSPQEVQLSTNDLNEYVNTFILYDFPEHLRLFNYRTTLTFYTKPNIDVYETTAVAGDPLDDFENAYITSHDPVYIGGYRAYFTQSRSDFYAIYPALQSYIRIGTGDGATTTFAGTLSSKPVLRYNVLFSSIDANNNGLSAYDEDGDGILYGDCVLSTINYVTGVYTVTFTAAPANRTPVYAQIVPYQASRPQAMLYFDNKFTLRPVPDMPYQVSIETYIRPTDLENATDAPDLEQYWQYIALSAAKKILIDRLDLETVQLLEPELKKQELLCLRRTIVQQSNERTATIYTQMTDLGASGWNWNNLG